MRVVTALTALLVFGGFALPARGQHTDDNGLVGIFDELNKLLQDKNGGHNIPGFPPKGAPPPTPAAAGKFFVIGGFNSTGNDTNTTEVRAPADPAWTVSGPLNTQRALGGAVVLPNGRVLAAGGEDNDSNQLSSSELYDPATGVWTPTGDLVFPRSYFQLVLLPNGSALALGGFGPNPAGPPLGQTTTEIYNPATGIWTQGASLNQPRAAQSTVVLGDGTVLTVGGVASVIPNATRANAEILTPGAAGWVLTGPMNVLRTSEVLVSLGSRALTAGGFPFSAIATDSTEIYDLATNSWTVSGNLNQARGVASATVLTGGTVLIAGGYLAGVNATNTAELWNPLTGTWSYTGSMTTPRLLFQMLNVPGSGDTQAYAAGGRANLGNTLTPGLAIYNSTETYDLPTGTWTPGPTMVESHSDFNMVIIDA